MEAILILSIASIIIFEKFNRDFKYILYMYTQIKFIKKENDIYVICILYWNR